MIGKKPTLLGNVARSVRKIDLFNKKKSILICFDVARDHWTCQRDRILEKKASLREEKDNVLSQLLCSGPFFSKIQSLWQSNDLSPKKVDDDFYFEAKSISIFFIKKGRFFEHYPPLIFIQLISKLVTQIPHFQANYFQPSFLWPIIVILQ